MKKYQPAKNWRRGGERQILPKDTEARVISFSEVHAPPIGFERYKPYIVAVLAFEDDTKISAQLVDVKPEDLHLGDICIPVFRRLHEVSPDAVLPYGIKWTPIQKSYKTHTSKNFMSDDEFLRVFDEKFEVFLDHYSEMIKEDHPEFFDHFSILKEYLMRGGKRVRPWIAYTVYSLFGSEEMTDEGFKVLFALEFMQAGLLAHDDIMDESDIRRGKPSLHRIYEQLSLRENSEKDGENKALIMGTLYYFLVYQILIDVNIYESDRLQILSAFSEAFLHTGVGQMKDIEFEGADSITTAEVDMIHSKKTAAYTGILPAIVGGILAGVDKDKIKMLSEFGSEIGHAFQIKDDLIGAFSSVDESGKPEYSDIEDAKATLLLAEARARASLYETEVLARFVGQKGLRFDQVRQVQTVFASTGAKQYSEDRLAEHINKAKAILENLGVDDTRFYKLFSLIS